VLVTGGIMNLKTTEVYDPTAGVWQQGPSMSEGHAGHTATLLESGQVLVLGGTSETAELFDPKDTTWKTIAVH
jgi:hypothetical protein